MLIRVPPLMNHN